MKLLAVLALAALAIHGCWGEITEVCSSSSRTDAKGDTTTTKCDCAGKCETKECDRDGYCKPVRKPTDGNTGNNGNSAAASGADCSTEDGSFAGYTCKSLKRAGYCHGIYEEQLKKNCPHECDYCKTDSGTTNPGNTGNTGTTACTDQNPSCKYYKQYGYCARYAANCPCTCGKTTSGGGGTKNNNGGGGSTKNNGGGGNTCTSNDGNLGQLGPSCSGSVPIKRCPMSTEYQKAILKAHNDLRQKVASGSEGYPAGSIPPLQWDAGLAEEAQKLVNNCQFDHYTPEVGNFGRVGQNLCSKSFSSPGKPLDENLLVGCVNGWYDEIKDYKQGRCNIKSFPGKFSPQCPTSGKDIGHFTQVIWGKTTHVGCGWVQFDGGMYQGFRMVRSNVFCNYGPAGNMDKAPVYE